MRILMFGMSSYPGGIENYIVNYFCHPLFPEDIKIDFVTYEPTIAYEEKLLQKQYRVHRVPHLKKHPLGYYKALRRLMRENHYDCIYVNMLSAANILPLLVCQGRGPKTLVLHAHANSTVTGFVRKTLHTLNKRYIKKRKALRLSCSREAGEWLFDSLPVHIIPNAIDCERFVPSPEHRAAVREELGLSDTDLVLGHVGRITEEKNHVFMLQILEALLPARPDARLVFVGNGNLREATAALAEAMGLSDRVLFYGTSSQTQRLYAAFDVFLFPSLFEGFGMAALEAQSCGLPVLCSDCLSPELNVSGALQYLPLDNTAAWVDAILAAQPTKESADASHQRVAESSYNIQKQIQALSELLQHD